MLLKYLLLGEFLVRVGSPGEVSSPYLVLFAEFLEISSLLLHFHRKGVFCLNQLQIPRNEGFELFLERDRKVFREEGFGVRSAAKEVDGGVDCFEIRLMDFLELIQKHFVFLLKSLDQLQSVTHQLGENGPPEFGGFEGVYHLLLGHVELDGKDLQQVQKQAIEIILRFFGFAAQHLHQFPMVL